jgi:RNA polymerase sigma-70 factor (ECF subfamily)
MVENLKVSNLSERELVLAAQKGDIAAFKQLYEVYRDSTYNLIFHLLGNAALSEDVLQTVFIKAFQALPSFRFEAKFVSWLYRIAINECHTQQRRQAAYVPLETILGTGKELETSTQDFYHLQGQKQEIIQNALLELSPNLREVVVLKYLDGFSYEEISVVLQCSTGTVASRLNRALTQLEKYLQPLKKFLLER